MTFDPDSSPPPEFVDENEQYETESAFKPLLWLIVPFVLILLYGALG